MYLIDHKPTSKKEREIVKEIESYGFHVIWIKGMFRRYADFRGDENRYLSDIVAMTTRATMEDGKKWDVVVVSKEAIRNSKKMWIHSTPVSNLIHELAHVIQIREKTLSLDDPDIFDKAHGLRFCEIYTDLIDKYDIRYAERDFYLGVLE